jgi:hypothetical protein
MKRRELIDFREKFLKLQNRAIEIATVIDSTWKNPIQFGSFNPKDEYAYIMFEELEEYNAGSDTSVCVFSENPNDREYSQLYMRIPFNFFSMTDEEIQKQVQADKDLFNEQMDKELKEWEEYEKQLKEKREKKLYLKLKEKYENK